MSFIVSHWLALLFAWLLVSFPIGWGVGKMLKRIDLGDWHDDAY